MPLMTIGSHFHLVVCSKIIKFMHIENVFYLQNYMKIFSQNFYHPKVPSLWYTS